MSNSCISYGQRRASQRGDFQSVLDILARKNYQIVEGVDKAIVEEYRSRLEALEKALKESFQRLLCLWLWSRLSHWESYNQRYKQPDIPITLHVCQRQVFKFVCVFHNCRCLPTIGFGDHWDKNDRLYVSTGVLFQRSPATCRRYFFP